MKRMSVGLMVIVAGLMGTVTPYAHAKATLPPIIYNYNTASKDVSDSNVTETGKIHYTIDNAKKYVTPNKTPAYKDQNQGSEFTITDNEILKCNYYWPQKFAPSIDTPIPEGIDYSQVIFINGEEFPSDYFQSVSLQSPDGKSTTFHTVNTIVDDYDENHIVVNKDSITVTLFNPLTKKTLKLDKGSYEVLDNGDKFAVRLPSEVTRRATAEECPAGGTATLLKERQYKEIREFLYEVEIPAGTDMSGFVTRVEYDATVKPGTTGALSIPNKATVVAGNSFFNESTVETRIGTVSATKVDSETNAPLSGAEFELHKCVAGTTDLLPGDKAVNVAGNTKFISDAQGKVNIQGLQDPAFVNGVAVENAPDYCLVETKAPEGYARNARATVVKFNNANSVSVPNYKDTPPVTETHTQTVTVTPTPNTSTVTVTPPAVTTTETTSVTKTQEPVTVTNTVTNTQTSTNTVTQTQPGTTVTQTMPGTTVTKTEPGATVTNPTTVTEPGTTVTKEPTTVTNTSTAPAETVVVTTTLAPTTVTETEVVGSGTTVVETENKETTVTETTTTEPSAATTTVTGAPTTTTVSATEPVPTTSVTTSATTEQKPSDTPRVGRESVTVPSDTPVVDHVPAPAQKNPEVNTGGKTETVSIWRIIKDFFK